MGPRALSLEGQIVQLVLLHLVDFIRVLAQGREVDFAVAHLLPLCAADDFLQGHFEGLRPALNVKDEHFIPHRFVRALDLPCFRRLPFDLETDLGRSQAAAGRRLDISCVDHVDGEDRAGHDKPVCVFEVSLRGVLLSFA